MAVPVRVITFTKSPCLTTILPVLAPAVVGAKVTVISAPSLASAADLDTEYADRVKSPPATANSTLPSSSTPLILRVWVEVAPATVLASAIADTGVVIIQGIASGITLIRPGLTVLIALIISAITPLPFLQRIVSCFSAA